MDMRDDFVGGIAAKIANAITHSVLLSECDHADNPVSGLLCADFCAVNNGLAYIVASSDKSEDDEDSWVHALALGWSDRQV